MTTTKGNIIVENIKIGDIHYEFAYNNAIKVEVISLPVRHAPDTAEVPGGYWTWQSKVISDNPDANEKVIDYGVTEGLAHYGPNLYDYEAYTGCKFI